LGILKLLFLLVLTEMDLSQVLKAFFMQNNYL